MKKVLIIAYYFPPMGMGGVQRTAKFVRYLPDFGWEATVLTVKPIHYYAHDDSLLQEVDGQRIIRTDSMDPLRLQYLLRRIKPKSNSSDSKMKHAKPEFLDKINFNLSPWLFIPDTKVPWVPWAIHHAVKLLKHETFDLVFTTSPPHSVHLIGRYLKKKFDINWVADFRDNWLAESYEKLPTLLHRIINHKMATGCVQSADHIIAICDPIAEYLQELTQKNRASFSVIPNGYDRSDFESVLLKSKNDKFTIRYCGGLYPARSPEPFFKGLAIALQQKPELSNYLSVEFVGSINGISMNKLIQTYDLEKIIKLHGYVSHEKNVQLLQTSDLLLLLISADSSPGIVTGKVFEYLAAGRPVLGVVPQGEASKLLEKHHRGWVVHPNHSEKIALSILHAYNAYVSGNLKIKVDRWESISHLNRYEQTRQLADLFEQVAG